MQTCQCSLQDWLEKWALPEYMELWAREIQTKGTHHFSFPSLALLGTLSNHRCTGPGYHMAWQQPRDTRHRKWRR